MTSPIYDRPERWYADAFELSDGWVCQVASYQGLFTGPTLLTTDIDIPMRDGVLPGYTRLSPGGFTLELWTAGNDRMHAMNTWEQLLRTVVVRHKLVRWTHQRPDGTVREAWGRVVGRVAPTPVGRFAMKAQLEVTIPSGTWQSPAEADTGHISLTGTSGALDRYVNLVNFEGISAPLTTLRAHLRGPLTGLVVSCPETGSWFRYDVPLTAGQDLWVDNANDSIIAPQIDAFRYKGPYMIEAMPPYNPQEYPVVRVQATQAGPGATIRVRGRRLYLM